MTRTVKIVLVLLGLAFVGQLSHRADPPKAAVPAPAVQAKPIDPAAEARRARLEEAKMEAAKVEAAKTSKQMDCINTTLTIERMSGKRSAGWFLDLRPYETICPK